MRDPQFLLILTKDVMKLFFISVLDTKALVTDGSFIPLHLSLSLPSLISVSLLSPPNQFTSMAHH